MKEPLIIETTGKGAMQVTLCLKRQAIRVVGTYAYKKASYMFTALLSDEALEDGIHHGRIKKLKVFRVYPTKGRVEIGRFRKYWFTFSKDSSKTHNGVNRRNLRLLVNELERLPVSHNLAAGFVKQLSANKLP